MKNVVDFTNIYNSKQLDKQKEIVDELLCENQTVFSTLIERGYLSLEKGVNTCSSLLIIQKNLLEIQKLLHDVRGKSKPHEKLDCFLLMRIGTKIKETNDLRVKLLGNN